MRNASIFLVEDEKEHRELIIGGLEKQGHRVTLMADTLESAVALIQEGKLAEAKITMAIISGRVRIKPGHITAWAGPIIAGHIRNAGLKVKIVAYGYGPSEDYDYGDVFVSKLLPIGSLCNAVNAL